MWILDKKDTAPNPHPSFLSDPNPAKRIGSEDEEIPAIAQFSAKPETERWWEFLNCVSLTKKMHPVMLAAQRFCGFLAPIHFQPHRSATKLVFNHYNGRQFLCKVNSENDEEKFESGKRIPGMGIIHSWYPFSAHSFSLMICSYSRTYFSSMTRFVW